jgi:2Fe-2S ferredoxin
MANVRVTPRGGGAELTLDAPDGRPLMEVLRDSDTGVIGTCGGMCSCGTCHVYVKESWVAKLPPRTPDEEMMLEGIGELVEVRPTSRLSCQIEIDSGLEGLEIEIGPIA